MSSNSNTTRQEASHRPHPSSSSEAQSPPPQTPVIRPISPTQVSRIVSGQAITDLPSAIKELLDNSIDANASRVTIKLYNSGLDDIEVSDNGTGVPRGGRDAMATRHATSKLRSFDDLYSSNNNSDGNGGDWNGGDDGNNAADDASHGCAPTLGFRGEALFSLSNVSRSLRVTTRTPDERLGEQFAFDVDGELMVGSIKSVPRRVGTTVNVVGLFERLPVRRVDMTRRIRGQRMKLMKMMQGCEFCHLVLCYYYVCCCC